MTPETISKDNALENGLISRCGFIRMNRHHSWCQTRGEQLYCKNSHSALPCVNTACCDQSSDFVSSTEAIGNKQLTSERMERLDSMGALLEFLPSVYFYILKLELNTYTERKKRKEEK